ncbi:glycosyltransferase family 4 protein [Mucilaginibacter sp.]|uniref:glycosyltransferase family 4 protein n=1 Tax=Mucilaginibacter sp. TaxID=1882438 RepID=UPI0025DAE51D|nr:glycosyltransferase family 4 protein [Mucilaginibacter sp.]
MAKTQVNKTLFISHEASRSGAPIVLLHLLKWIKKNTDLQFDVLLLTDGPLRSDFETLAETFVLSKLTRQHSYQSRIKRKLRKTTLNDEYKKAAATLAKNKYSLVYGNTIVSLPWLTIFKENHGIKTLCCIHELSYATGYFFTNAYIEENLALTDGVIAVSGAVKTHLMASFNVVSEKISLHYEFIDTDVTPAFNNDLQAVSGIDKGQFVIGTGGAPSWRKGTDLIILLVLKLTELYPGFDFKIAWLGADAGDEWAKLLRYDAVKCGVDDKLLFISNKPDPLNYINLFDVFVLLSREDPFPLIVLEAAFLKKPVIAFENSGGIPEFVTQGAGLLAPYLNITKLAELVYQLSRDSDAAKQMGIKGNELVVNNYSIDQVAPAIYKQIDKLTSPAVA